MLKGGKRSGPSKEAIELRKKSSTILSECRLNEHGYRYQKLTALFNESKSLAEQAYQLCPEDQQICEQLVAVNFRYGAFLSTEHAKVRHTHQKRIYDTLVAITYFQTAMTLSPQIGEQSQKMGELVHLGLHSCYHRLAIEYQHLAEEAAKIKDLKQEIACLGKAYEYGIKVDSIWVQAKLRESQKELLVFHFKTMVVITKYLHIHEKDASKALQFSKSCLYYAKLAGFNDPKYNGFIYSAHKNLALKLRSFALDSNQDNEETLRLFKESLFHTLEAIIIKPDSVSMKLHFLRVDAELQYREENYAAAHELFIQCVHFTWQYLDALTDDSRKRHLKSLLIHHTHMSALALQRQLSKVVEREERASLARKAINLYLSINDKRKAGIVYCILGDKIHQYFSEYWDQATPYYNEGVKLIIAAHQHLHGELFSTWFNSANAALLEEAETLQGKHEHGKALEKYKRLRDNVYHWGKEQKNPHPQGNRRNLQLPPRPQELKYPDLSVDVLLRHKTKLLETMQFSVSPRMVVPSGEAINVELALQYNSELTEEFSDSQEEILSDKQTSRGKSAAGTPRFFNKEATDIKKTATVTFQNVCDLILKIQPLLAALDEKNREHYETRLNAINMQYIDASEKNYESAGSEFDKILQELQRKPQSKIKAEAQADVTTTEEPAVSSVQETPKNNTFKRSRRKKATEQASDIKTTAITTQTKISCSKKTVFALAALGVFAAVAVSYVVSVAATTVVDDKLNNPFNF